MKQREKNPLLEIIEEKNSKGLLQGRHPMEVPLNELSPWYGAKNPVKAIRARCLDCCCGQPTEVRKCVATDCASWPFRMGSNPFRKRLSADERQRRSDNLNKPEAAA